MLKLIKLFPGLLLCHALSAPTAMALQTFITIGTGDVAGVYYHTGVAICRQVNKGRRIHDIGCSVKSTDGSIDNLNMIRGVGLDMGVVQSDWQFHGYHGTSRLKDHGPFKELRAIFSMYPEPFTVVARNDAGIEHFTDLRDKRVNIGNPGSGPRATMEVVMQALGWTKDNFSFASELNAARQSTALCENKIDAMVFMSGHPSDSLKEITASCDSVIVEVSGPAIDKLIEQNPYYRHATIPGGMYRGNPNDVKSFGVSATFVSSTQTPAKVVYEVVKAVFGNFNEFKKLYPVFAILVKEQMTSEGLSAPLHPGAEQYYKETGY